MGVKPWLSCSPAQIKHVNHCYGNNKTDKKERIVSDPPWPHYKSHLRPCQLLAWVLLWSSYGERITTGANNYTDYNILRIARKKIDN